MAVWAGEFQLTGAYFRLCLERACADPESFVIPILPQAKRHFNGVYAGRHFNGVYAGLVAL